MNSNYYKPIACGLPLPLDNPHAFSVSMPTYKDVIDYEEGTNDIFSRICSAYPRIVFHPSVMRATEAIRKELKIADDLHLFLLPSKSAAELVIQSSQTEPELFEYKNFAIATFDCEKSDDITAFYSFMKHCGYMIYSREAESILRSFDTTFKRFPEEVFDGNSEQEIKKILTSGYKNSRDIEITSSGMNAIYAGYEATKQLGMSKGRTLFIQLGWAYCDTIHIQNKLSDEFIHIASVDSMSELNELLNNRGNEVAGLLVETISNPLMQTPDIPELSRLAKKFDFPLLVDNTFATPWNCEISEYSDLIFESLTKFASGRGDIMAGTVILPESSTLPKSFMDEIRKFTVPLFNEEADRLAFTIGDYQDRVNKINDNTKRLVEFFTNHPMTEQLFHVFLPENEERYKKIANDAQAYGGVLSIVLKDDFEKIYDAIDLPKGPSLGCDFPLLMPYTLLAHYDMIKSSDGQKKLKEINLSPWLIRISVGEDDPQLIMDQFQNAYEKVNSI